jgi:hypothetical protein
MFTHPLINAQRLAKFQLPLFWSPSGYNQSTCIKKTNLEILAPVSNIIYRLFLLFQADTSYDSPLWTTKDTFYAQFWSAKVNEVCLSTGSGDPGFFVQFPVQAPSLRSLLVQKKALNINASVWQRGSVNLLDLNFTEGCYEAGFNVGDPSGIQARIGIVSVGR